jgi:hypothetical protein
MMPLAVRFRYRTPRRSFDFWVPVFLVYLLLLPILLLGALVGLVLVLIPSMRAYVRLGYALVLLPGKAVGTVIHLQDNYTEISIRIT